MSAGWAGITGHGPLGLAHQQGTPTGNTKPTGQTSDGRKINHHISCQHYQESFEFNSARCTGLFRNSYY